MIPLSIVRTVEIHDWSKGTGGVSARVSISELDHDETN